MTVVHVPGKKLHKVMLYALSTCGWCRKTRQLLEELGVEYDYEYVDLLRGEEQTKTMDKVKHWNPACNFPTMVIDNHAETPVYYVGTNRNGVYSSDNGGITWNAYNNGLDKLKITTLKINAANPGKLYAGTLDGGVWITS